MTLIDVYDRAESQGIRVDNVPMRKLSSVSFPQGFIALDAAKLKTAKEEKLALAHELGHVETGSFYNIYSKYDLRAKHERKAEKRAIEMLIPIDELLAAIEDGATEIWQIAERFDVPEPMVRRAMVLYEASLKGIA